MLIQKLSEQSEPMKLTRFVEPLKHKIQAIYDELFGFITMFYTYILYSKKLNAFYKGETKNILDRLYRHNSGYEKSTKLGTPWILLWQDVKSTKSEAKQLTNNVIVSIDNTIITDLDINKEINFLKFINKDQAANNPELLKKEIVNSLIDRKIKDIETNYFKIEVSEKEIEINLYNYLERIKINNEIINSFYNQNEIEKDYLKNIIKIDMKWSKLVRQLYESRLNVNLTEVNKELEKKQNNSVDDEKLNTKLIIIEQNKLLNKFSATHLEKSKKKYLIKFL